MSNKNFAPRATRYHAYNAWLLSQMSNIVYEQPNTWPIALKPLGFRLVKRLNADVTQAFVATDGRVRILVFRGTEFSEPMDIVADARARLVPGPWGKVHRGFNEELDEVWDELIEFLKTPQKESLWITGHSMGAAMALLTAARLKVQGIPVQGIYAYAAPRVGNPDFCSRYDKALRHRTWRFMNDNDIVTRLPAKSMGYGHIGRLIFFDCHGDRRPNRPQAKWLRAKLADFKDELGDGLPEAISDHFLANYIAATTKELDESLKTGKKKATAEQTSVSNQTVTKAQKAQLQRLKRPAPNKS